MSATLESLLELLPWLDDPKVEDICIQEPEVVWVFAEGKFTRYEAPGLGREEIDDIAIVAGAQRRRDFGINYSKPIMGVDLVHRDGRLHAVGEPCVEGCTNLVIRKGSEEWPELEDLIEQGLFKSTSREGQRPRSPIDAQLSDLYRQGDFGRLLGVGAANRRTIILAGTNGSGKTHVSKALIGQIPRERRLIVIENARELRGIPHPNKVCFYYDKDDTNGIKPTDLVDAAMRMRTEQIFLQEIRDGWETLAFMIAGQTGHKGAITTIHAGSCKEVTARMKAAIKMTDAGRGWSDDDVLFSLRNLVDIVAHVSRDSGTWACDEVLYQEHIQ